MTLELDITESEHPECREQVLETLQSLDPGAPLRIKADHDPEPVLREYAEEENPSVEWSRDKDGPDVWTLIVTKSGTNPNGEFDVREIPPPQRHEKILKKVQSLEVGEDFILINDHDPKPLFYELKSIHGDSFDWSYEKKETDDYRVKITKTAESQELPDEASTRVDVRVIPPSDRHKTIFHRFDLLTAGDAMEIVADHDPEPLYHQLKDAHGEDAFDWEYRLKEPGECRVLLRNQDDQEGTSTSSTGSTPVSSDSDEDHPELDVRSYEPQKRHDLIYERYEDLEPGDAFVLINDHDPKPLYYQMQEEMSGDIHWDYLKEGGNEWRVLIGKN
ncbi:MAG: DUF2249 domain-containing protein [bacterium]